MATAETVLGMGNPRTLSPSGVKSRVEYTRIDTNNRKDEQDDDDDFLQKEIRSQRMEMQQQDESLDELHKAVKQLGDVSLTISHELDSQNKMLDDLNEETDKSQEALSMLTRKTRELIESSGGTKWFCAILWLSLILTLLTYLVIMS